MRRRWREARARVRREEGEVVKSVTSVPFAQLLWSGVVRELAWLGPLSAMRCLSAPSKRQIKSVEQGGRRGKSQTREEVRERQEKRPFDWGKVEKNWKLHAMTAAPLPWSCAQKSRSETNPKIFIFSVQCTSIAWSLISENLTEPKPLPFTDSALSHFSSYLLVLTQSLFSLDNVNNCSLKLSLYGITCREWYMRVNVGHHTRDRAGKEENRSWIKAEIPRTIFSLSQKERMALSDRLTNVFLAVWHKCLIARIKHAIFLMFLAATLHHHVRKLERNLNHS